jgi:predicted anti-sigma-YlaC factor YlaD
MNVTREVVMDLLPVYFSGEASPDTRALVEEFLKKDPDLSKGIRERWLENMAKAVPSSIPPELELKAFRRARSLLVWQRWLMGFAMFFTALLPSSQFTLAQGRVADFHFLLRDYPAVFAVCASLAAAFWIAYFAVRHGLRSPA